MSRIKSNPKSRETSKTPKIGCHPKLASISSLKPPTRKPKNKSDEPQKLADIGRNP